MKHITATILLLLSSYACTFSKGKAIPSDCMRAKAHVRVSAADPIFHPLMVLNVK